ncbi:hypothetical protein OEZ85_013845 [Tetradesmus obliquus]|uniref:Adaptor protein ClpS core domain-containing protein n=1 Tax=Tetradesmus obliquus TaxID=3088 RepID=A0ABY8U695_TETOB|nr:hypothetical protein OEZ85_013845 [Tetradesmus obliquus]
MNTYGLRGSVAARAAGRPSLNSSSRSHRAATAVTHASKPVQARFGGGGVMDRPGAADYDVGKRGGWDSDKDGNVATLPPPTDTGRDGGSTDKQNNSPPGGGNHRLLLLDSPKHTEGPVVKSLTYVVPACDEAHARNCFATSKELGMAIVTSCLKEHAEFYMQQLYRYGVRTAIEPDNTMA